MVHPYASEAYAYALGDAGRPIKVRDWGAYVFGRPISGGGEDAIGPYPRTPFLPGADLVAGLAQLREEGLVSVVVVPDPLFSPDAEKFKAAFEVYRPFKTHAIVDVAKGYDPTKHHRQEIRRGGRKCRVELVSLSEKLREWTDLYGCLVTRRNISGVSDFSKSYFYSLSKIEGIVAFAAYVSGEIVAMHIWCEYGRIAQSHLAASNSIGYSTGANYALNDAAISYFSEFDVIDLGGAAGNDDNPADGLFRFKQGFANGAVVAKLCGAVLDRPEYEALSEGLTTSFFPAYRGAAV